VEWIQTWPQAFAVVGVAVCIAAAICTFFWSMTR
jgi:hypothetical protein